MKQTTVENSNPESNNNVSTTKMSNSNNNNSTSSNSQQLQQEVQISQAPEHEIVLFVKVGVRTFISKIATFKLI